MRVRGFCVTITTTEVVIKGTRADHTGPVHRDQVGNVALGPWSQFLRGRDPEIRFDLEDTQGVTGRDLIPRLWVLILVIRELIEIARIKLFVWICVLPRPGYCVEVPHSQGI